MKSRLDVGQDITLWLTEKEKAALLLGPTNDFYEMHECSEQVGNDGKYYTLLKARLELDAYIFLGYSADPQRIFSRAQEMDGFGKIRIPDEQGFPWLINLSSEGIEHFKNDWPYGIRYDGEHKLFILKDLK